MKITQEDFERVVGIVYRRGAIRSTNPFAVVSENEIKDIVLDVYDLLKYNINASQSAVEADAESRCEFCGETNCKDAECEDDY